MKKWILGGVLLVIAVIVGVVFYTATQLDSLVEAGIERFGPRALGASVEVGSVDISIEDGKGTIRNVLIGNPEGFKSPNSFSLGEITVQIDPETMVSDTIVLKEISVVAPQVTYEVSAGKGTNIAAIQRNIQAFAKSNGAAGPGEQEIEKEGKKLIIDRFSLTDGVVTLAATELDARQLSAPLPPIRLTDIGRKSNGATAADAMRQVFAVLAPAIVNAVQKLGVEGVLGGAAETGRGVVEGAESGAEGVGGALKGLFGK